MRIFAALPPSPAFIDAAWEALAPLREARQSFRWTPRENLHVTLAFLGELDTAGLAILDDVLRATVTNVNAIGITAEKLVALPRGRGANALAMPLGQGKQRVCQLASFFEQNLARAAVQKHYPFRPQERRAFTPHITVARGLGGAALPLGFAPGLAHAPCPAGVLDRAVIFKSDLLKSGAVYTPLAVHLLKT